jgi:O-antigen/teichoic acid export membrane protein
VDWPNFRGVIRIGLPMSGIGYIYTSLWISLEGTFILEWFGVKSLGLYGMAAFIRTVVVQLAQNMNQVLDVKIYEQYGRTGEIEDCLKRILTPMLLAFFASFPAIVIGWYALPYVVNLLIPKYIEAIPIMRVILFAMPITFLILPITILWAIGTKFYCFASVVIGFLTFVGVSYLLRSLNFGVSGVLIASMLGQLMYIFSAYCLIYKLSLRTKAVATAEE